MSTYTRTREIGTYTVSKLLVQQIEEFIAEDIPIILGIDKPKKHR